MIEDDYIKLTYEIVTRFINNNGYTTPEGLFELMAIQSEYEEGKYERLLGHAKAISNILNTAIKSMEESEEK